ncbi:hypothetical protein BCR42DRAFT_445573 [Absidia repens]|uniref:Uncharacterized protein n=1 Tax=Absidia repens TaxID=90262 RepID=A0A1X2J1X9_9FUNG|nr:hypothetical protein BCR42DRAFT_445573 [Absidia repens]
MLETFLLDNTIFIYGAFILISAISIVFIPSATPIILGTAGLTWTWLRRKSSQPFSNSNSTPSMDAFTWASVYEKIDKNTSQVQYLSQLRLDSTQQQRALLEDLETLTNTFNSYRSTHEKDLDQAIQSLNALQQQNDALKLDNTTMTTTIDALRLRNSDQDHHKSTLQTQLNSLQLDKDVLLKKLSAMEHLKGDLEHDLNLLRQCRETDIQKVAAMEEAINKLETEHTKLRTDNESTANALTTMEKQAGDLRHEKDTVNQQLDVLRLENGSLMEKVAAMEHEGDTWNQQTATFEQQLDSMSQEKADLERTLATMEQEKDNQTLQMNALRKEIDILQQDKDTRSKEMDVMAQELATMKDKDQDLTEQQQQQAETKEREWDELKEQLNNEKRKTEHLQLFVRENTKELHRVAADALGYQQQVEELKTQLEQQQDQCAEMEQQMNELNLDAHEKDMVMADMQQKEERLIAELDEMGQKVENEDEMESIMERIQQHMVDLKHLEKNKEAILIELDTLEENKKMAVMDLEALEDDKRKLSTFLKKSLTQQQHQQSGDGSSWHEPINDNTDHHNDNNKFQRPRSPHVNYPLIKTSRSSSIPRLSNTNLSLSRSKSSRLATASGTRKSMGQYELYQTVRRLEGVIAELQRQLDDSQAQLEDREQRLCHFLANDTVR